jgi:hypothetical protein
MSPVVERQLVRQVAALGDLDRVDLADEVRDGDVGRGQLFGIATIARDPVDGGRVSVALDDRACGRTDRSQRVVVELASGDDGEPRIEETDEQPRHPRLGLPALAEEDEVVAGEDRVLDGRDDRILVADDTREDLAARREPGEEVGPQLFLDRARAPARGDQLTQRRGLGRGAIDRFHGWLPRCVGRLGRRA